MRELIAALRCSATAGSKCRRDDCRYFRKPMPEEVAEIIAESGWPADLVMDRMCGCDCDQIALDAADALESFMTGRK